MQSNTQPDETRQVAEREPVLALESIAGRTGYWFTFRRQGRDFHFWIGNPVDAIQDLIVQARDFYEANLLELVQSMLPPAPAIVDVGANIGNHTIFFSAVCGASKVIPIEPNPDVVVELRANVAANGCENVDLSRLGFAVGAASGTGSLELSPSDEAIHNRGGMKIEPAAGSLRETVEIRRLDDLDLGEIDLLKIDVEGLAMPVLSGASELLGRCRPIIIVEIENEIAPAFLAWVSSAGYRVAAIVGHHLGIANYLLVPTGEPSSDRAFTSAGASADIAAWSAAQAEKARADRSEATLAISISALRSAENRANRTESELAQTRAELAAQSERIEHEFAAGRDAEQECARLEARIANLDGERERISIKAGQERAQLEARIAELDSERERILVMAGQERAQLEARIAELDAEKKAISAKAFQERKRLETRNAELAAAREQARALLDEEREWFNVASAQVARLESKLGSKQEIADLGFFAARTLADGARRPMRTAKRIFVSGMLAALNRGGVKFRRRGKVNRWIKEHDPARYLRAFEARGFKPDGKDPLWSIEPAKAGVTESRERHKESLPTTQAHPVRSSPATNGPRTLFIDSRHPDPTRDSGSIDTLNYVAWLRSMGQEIDFVAIDQYAANELLEEPIRRLGAEIVNAASAPDFEAFLRESNGRYNILFLSRVHCGGRYLEMTRRANPKAAVIFNTVDLHHVREDREARLKGDQSGIFAAGLTRDRECHIVRQADLTIVVSESERQILESEVPGARVAVIPLFRPLPVDFAGFEARFGIGFVGGFDHMPNIDAIRYFLAEVWPKIRTVDRAITFCIAGPSLPPDIEMALPEGVTYAGQVPDLEAWLAKLRVTVAPLRYGAGAKGKVASSVVNGVPVVGTSIAFEGMKLPDDCRIAADDPGAMAEAVFRLHDDSKLWKAVSDGCRRYAEAELSPDVGARRFTEIIAATIGRLRPDSDPEKTRHNASDASKE